jgi:hypothetical protein
MSSFSGGVLGNITGAQNFAYRREIDTYVALEGDFVIEMAHASGGKIVTLPALATTTNGRTFIVINNSANGTSRIRPQISENINGTSQYQLSNQYDSAIVVKAANEWLVMATSL